MASIKIHAFRGTHTGAEDCDFRGDKFVGHEQGDEHRTLLEVDPAPDALVEAVLEVGAKLNALFGELTAAEPDALGTVASALGLDGEGPVGLRVGVWDN
jgi:hypothetical protein